MSGDVQILTVGQEYDLILQFNRFVRLERCRFQGNRKEGLLAFLVPQQQGMVTPELLTVTVERIGSITIPGGGLIKILSRAVDPPPPPRNMRGPTNDARHESRQEEVDEQRR